MCDDSTVGPWKLQMAISLSWPVRVANRSLNSPRTGFAPLQETAQWAQKLLDYARKLCKMQLACENNAYDPDNRSKVRWWPRSALGHASDASFAARRFGRSGKNRKNAQIG